MEFSDTIITWVFIILTTWLLFKPKDKVSTKYRVLGVIGDKAVNLVICPDSEYVKEESDTESTLEISSESTSEENGKSEEESDKGTSLSISSVNVPGIVISKEIMDLRMPRDMAPVTKDTMDSIYNLEISNGQTVTEFLKSNLKLEDSEIEAIKGLPTGDSNIRDIFQAVNGYVDRCVNQPPHLVARILPD